MKWNVALEALVITWVSGSSQTTQTVSVLLVESENGYARMRPTAILSVHGYAQTCGAAAEDSSLAWMRRWYYQATSHVIVLVIVSVIDCSPT